jgi:hypothetical protein
MGDLLSIDVQIMFAEVCDEAARVELHGAHGHHRPRVLPDAGVRGRN